MQARGAHSLRGRWWVLGEAFEAAWGRCKRAWWVLQIQRRRRKPWDAKERRKKTKKRSRPASAVGVDQLLAAAAAEELSRIAKNSVQDYKHAVKVEARGDFLEMEATDLETRMRVALNCENANGMAWAAIVDANKLKKALKPDKRSEADRASFKLHETTKKLEVETDLTVKLPTAPGISPKEWPEREPECGRVAGEMAASHETLEWLLRSVSNDETRYNLNGVWFDAAKKRMVSTDGHRAHLYHGHGCAKIPDPASKNNDRHDFIVSGATVTALARALKKMNGNAVWTLAVSSPKGMQDAMNLVEAGGLVGLGGMHGSFSVSGRTIDGQFPVIDAVIPDSYELALRVSAGKLTKLLRRLKKISDGGMFSTIEKTNGGIELAVMPGYKDASGKWVPKTSEAICAECECEWDKADAEFKIGVNLNYLLDAYEKLDGDTVELRFIDDLSPIVVLREPGYKALVMPQRM